MTGIRLHAEGIIMSKQGCLIGIDGGGTKTDVCIAQTDGAVVRRMRLSGTNPSEIGVAAAFTRLADALRDADGVCALYAGIAGAADPAVANDLYARITAAFPGIARVFVTSDALNALNGEVGLADGIAVIAGTGASAFVRKSGSVNRIGGWGFLIDDAGGGFSLGQACLRAAYRAHDKRGAQTLLLSRVEEILGKPLEAAIPDIYAGGVARVASFAPVGLGAARAGDPVAMQLVEHCATEIAGLIAACRAQYDAQGVICVLSGGMFADDDLFKQVCQKAVPFALDLRRASHAPVYGALVAAAALCGRTADSKFRENYERTVEDT